eukprot:gene8743-8923_t
MQYGHAFSGLLRLRVTLAAGGWGQRLAWVHTPSGTTVYEDDQHPITEQTIPRPVWECLHVLRAAGHEVLLVGGAVRDLLLQHCEPKDYDMLTSAQLKQVKDLFRQYAPRVIGRNFPICQFVVQNVKIEISSWHTRLPVNRPAGSAAAATAPPPDVAEHYLGVASARLLYDYVGGVADAKSRQLRCIGDAGGSFQADPARLLRAVRCAARAGEVCSKSSTPSVVPVTNWLFGASTPQIASELLLNHLDMCKRIKQQQQRAGSSMRTAGRGLLNRSSSPSGRFAARRQLSSTSGQQHRVNQPDCQAFDFDVMMPRSNKQYKALMRQQAQALQALQQGSAAGAARVGSLDSIPSPGEMLVAAAIASTQDMSDDEADEGRSTADGGGTGRHWRHQQWVVAGVGLTAAQYVVHRVMEDADIGLAELEQQLAELLNHAWASRSLR